MNSLYQMTEKEFKQKQLRLTNAKEALDRAVVDMRTAREDGDLSENAAYDAARDKYRELQNEITILSNELDNCEIVHDDKSQVIKIGSTVQVTRVDDKDNPIAETRVFTMAQSGDTVIQKVLGATSPLGKAVLGKNSGVFDIICNGKKRYKVEKVIDD